MDFRLVDSRWDKELDNALHADHLNIRIVCPFIKKRVAERLIKYGKPKSIQVITRFNLADFCDGVSDTAAIRLLLENGAQIRGIRNLHAKLYTFGTSRAIMTSANLTDAALSRNHEFGFVTNDINIIGRCHQYFDTLWEKAGQNLIIERLAEWEEKLGRYLAGGARPARTPELEDEGVFAGVSVELSPLPAWVEDSQQSFVKFFGENQNRAYHSMLVLDEVRRSGCHWACTYPKDKRPRQALEGAIMFMGRLVKDPHDILIYGRAVGMRHQKGRDDATLSDIKLRPWKENWPHYIRVHHAEFIAGTLSNGISLGNLMGEMKSDAFASTQRNAENGAGNTDPRRAYMQQAAVELSAQGKGWLNARLERAFTQFGKLPPAVMAELDWPTIP